MFCGICGQQLNPNLKYCIKCGASIEINKDGGITAKSFDDDLQKETKQVKLEEKNKVEKAPATKICRYCDEEVKINAIVCKWCGRDFSEDYTPSSDDFTSTMIDFFLFKKMISIYLIKFIYFVGVFIGSAVTIVYMRKTYLYLCQRYQFSNNLILCVVIILAVIVVNLLWRLACEAGILFWSIHEAVISVEKKQ